MSHLVGFWPLRVGLQAGGPYGPLFAAVAVDSVARPPGRAKDRLNRATGGVPQTTKMYVTPPLSAMVASVHFS